MASEDYYKILGVAKSASEEDIKRAYRKLAQEHHPDKPTGNEARFKEINEAYQVLSNKERRAQYDRFGKSFSQNGGQGFGGGYGFEGFENVNFSDLGDFSEIFESFFGGGGSRRRKTYTHGSDLQIAQEITLEEAYTGIKKDIKFKAASACSDCEGLGHFAAEGVKTCETCNGRGEVKEVRNTFFGNFQQVRACAKCHGTGEIPNKICATCKGAGRIVTPRTLTVHILPGVADGQLIKMAGAGEAGERGAASGDLYVQIRIAPHKVFKRSGADVFVTKDIGAWDIVRGKTLVIPLISGDVTHVEIPAGTMLNEPIKVSGKGMPHWGSRGFGNLYVALNIRSPKKVSSKAKKALEELEGEVD